MENTPWNEKKSQKKDDRSLHGSSQMSELMGSSERAPCLTQRVPASKCKMGQFAQITNKICRLSQRFDERARGLLSHRLTVAQLTELSSISVIPFVDVCICLIANLTNQMTTVCVYGIYKYKMYFLLLLYRSLSVAHSVLCYQPLATVF